MSKPPLPQPMPQPSRLNKRGRLFAGGAAALLAAALVATLGGCQQDTDPGPGGVTVGEARALDEAAEMLDAQVTPAATPAPTPAPAATAS